MEHTFIKSKIITEGVGTSKTSTEKKYLSNVDMYLVE